MQDDEAGRPVRLAKGTGEQSLAAVRAVFVGKPPRVCTGVDLEAVAEPVLIVSQTGSVIALNAPAESLLGVDRRRVIGSQVDSLQQIEVVPSRRSGRTIPVELVMSPNPSQAATLIVLRELASTQEAAMARDEDVASIGHDLKTPLSVIALEVALLETRLAPADGSEVEGSFRRIGRNLAAIEKMLDDLLDLASIDAASFRIRREPTDLAGLVEDVVERIVSTRDRERVHVAVSGPAIVNADGPRLERVVANLVQNALKYAPTDSPIEVRLETAADRARVSVSDRGPGLPPDEAARVFERFRRARATRDKSGIGLGLFVSRKIVEAHGGRIDVDSVFGKGACFFFEIPTV